ncbi:MAG: MBL fold metallo-hydrolase [Pseudolabrys sp.]
MIDIPFNRNLNLVPDVVDEPIPGIRRVMANNPGPFTFRGTISYIIGRGKVAILDPGPDDAGHISALLEAVRNEVVTHIIVTHTHLDHSPAVKAIKAATGAKTYAEGPHRPSRGLHAGDILRPADRDFRPDVALKDGDMVEGDGWTLEAVTTPGHTTNHLTFAWRGTDVLFSGDHVMGWSTSIVAPPDGSMADYISSLHKLKQRRETLYFPGHGPAVTSASTFIDRFIAHRKQREQSILQNLRDGPCAISAIVGSAYAGLDSRLVAAARMTVLAHLEDLVARGLAKVDGGVPTIDSIFHL